MAGNYLLDISVAIAFLSGEHQVTQKIAAADSAYLSVVSFGELYYGAAKSGRPAANRQRVDQLVQQINVLNCDLVTAQLYGQIKGQLRARGTPIPDNDIWIAAAAWQHQLQLLTRDLHFQHISGLNMQFC